MLEFKLKAALAIPKPDLATKRKIITIKCHIWVFRGSLDHGFDYKKLLMLGFKYEAAGVVPTDYNHPSLYQ